MRKGSSDFKLLTSDRSCPQINRPRKSDGSCNRMVIFVHVNLQRAAQTGPTEVKLSNPLRVSVLFARFIALPVAFARFYRDTETLNLNVIVKEKWQCQGA